MTFSKILVGVDLGAATTAIARWVADHFAPNAELTLVYALDLPSPPDFLRGRVGDEGPNEETEQRAAEARLRQIAERVGAGARTEVRSGRPAGVLATAAKEANASLIVVGEHGKRRGLLGVLGSTAENLLHISPIPLLIVPLPPEGVPDSLVVPVDGSDMSDRVLAVARERAAQTSAHVVLVHVLAPGIAGRVGLISTDKAAAEFEEELIRETREWLSDRAKQAGFDPDQVSLHITFGAPGHEILAVAARLEDPIIVMGSRGAGAMGRMLLGSVARTVVRGAGCPVLVVTDHV